MWESTFTFTARYAWSVFPDDGTVFVSTGDISQMWLRDSTAQLMPYVHLAARSPAGGPLRRVLEGAMARQVRFILSDPYASAFYDSSGPGVLEGPNKQECPRSPNCHGCHCTHCSPACGNYTFQRDYELDAVLFPLLLHHRYWQATGSTAHLDSHFALALRTILGLLRTEQWHASKSKYLYMPPDKPVASGRRRRRFKEDIGSPGSTRFKEGVGLVWSFAMPSDDQAHGYNIPQNLMLVVTLRLAAELAAGPLRDAGLAG
jgi:meiotically up-regulated gene 157 (Mug157) protein